MKRVLLLLPLLCGVAFAQSSTVEMLGTQTAKVAENGFYVNIQQNEYGNELEYSFAAANHVKGVRLQFSWNQIECQTAPPLNQPCATQYALPSVYSTAIGFAHKYGLGMSLVMAYSPPLHQILTVTATNSVPVGATSFEVTFQSGVGGDTLLNIVPADYVFNLTTLHLSPSYGNISAHSVYNGSYISTVTQIDSTHAMIGLASAVGTGDNMVPGQQIGVNEVLYPAVADNTPANPSSVAYGNWLLYVAGQCAAQSVPCQHEIWNEPPWYNDEWDYAAGVFDFVNTGAWSSGTTYGLNSVVTVGSTPYISLVAGNIGNTPSSSPGSWSTTLPPDAWTGPPAFGANYGFVAYLQTKTFPPGTSATWAGTSGNGYASVLSPGMQSYSGVAYAQPGHGVTQEYFHPYGNTPEQANWIQPCIVAAGAATTYPANTYGPCQLSNEFGGNFIEAELLNQTQKAINPAYGIQHVVTETNEALPASQVSSGSAYSSTATYGLNAAVSENGVSYTSTVAGNVGNDPATTTGYWSSFAQQKIAQARFFTRQYAAYMADDVNLISGFQQWDGSTVGNGYSFANFSGGVATSYPEMTSMSGYLADIAPISNSPVAPYSALTLPGVSSYTGGTYPLAVVHMVGSRSGATANSDNMLVWQRSTCTAGCSYWYYQASPTPGSASVPIPFGLKVTSATNLTTRAAVPITVSPGLVTFAVSDDVVSLILDPYAFPRMNGAHNTGKGRRN